MIGHPCNAGPAGPAMEGYSYFRTMISELLENILGSEQGARLAEVLGGNQRADRAVITGTAGSLDALLITGIHRAQGRQVLVVTADHEEAERLRDDISLCAGPDFVGLFGHRESRAQTGDSGSDIRTLRALGAGEAYVAVTTVGSLCVPLPSPSAISGNTFRVGKGEEHPLSGLLGRLNALGFNQADFVESAGEYAVRGGILDIFPHAADNPVRIEFSGDTIESIREFDPLSQRSVRPLVSALIVPDLLNPAHGGGGERGSTLPDHLRNDALIVFLEPEILRGALRAEPEFVQREGEPDPFSTHRQTLSVVNLNPPPGAIDFGARPQPAFNASIDFFRKALAEHQQSGFAITVMAGGHAETARLKDLLGSDTRPFESSDETEDAGPEPDLSGIEFLSVSLHRGFIIPPLRRAVFTEHQIFNRLKRSGRRRAAKFRGLSEKEFHLLRRGDFVVHEDFGIGRFEGLTKIRVRSADQEVVSILYEGNDRVYVNLNYINKLQKYSSKEGHIPALSRLGGNEWERLKSRAKRKVKDIARELIKLYARRKSLPGFAFGVDTPWQKELEASFMYEDTFDQAKATREVKDDMQASWPMDRLVCGDVGFGKTEVAVRAAFKAVLDGKQVAVLVPTTILALQHHNTFLDRTSKYGLRIDVLSRFKTKKEQQGILTLLGSGQIDIVIGTHRLLSRDVVFKNLGLVIIDEEHRFGVAAKERLRQVRITVDTLALTATPIPRTLHFSLLGARDLSLIATPPRNRRPVRTEILEWNDEVIRDAVLREVQRGGQVFFVHDRILKMDELVERVRRLLPGIRVRSAHGQMHARELEEVMLEFLEKKFDLLVSTKIIESGLDLPNVNTVFINRADRFGMAELHQLRGRVGRSNVQAFAYLLTPPLSSVPQATLRRLQAVEEFTELGSGFNLAMRDLEIRGAGNLLGSEQSGFIETMGFETYTKVLEEAVRELKEEDFRELFQKELYGSPPPIETVVEPDFEALIPKHYVSNDTERLAIYRRLYTLNTEEQLAEIAGELGDRFGIMPEEVQNLFGVIRLRLFASRHRFRRIRLSPARMDVEFPPDSDARFYEGQQFQRLMQRISALRGAGARLVHDEKTLTLSLQIPASTTGSHVPEAALGLLRSLVSDDETKLLREETSM